MKDTITIQLLPPSEILTIAPLVQLLGGTPISEALLKERLLEMSSQNYECAVILSDEQLIGCCGLWFQTRHYAGRSIEIDHVIIKDAYRNSGIGTQLLDFVYAYAHSKKCNWIELNTYVDNFLSHKFYYKHGFVAKGYHFIKTL